MALVCKATRFDTIVKCYQCLNLPPDVHPHVHQNYYDKLYSLKSTT